MHEDLPDAGDHEAGHEDGVGEGDVPAAGLGPGLRLEPGELLRLPRVLRDEVAGCLRALGGRVQDQRHVLARAEHHRQQVGEDLDEAHHEGEDADVDDVGDDDRRDVVGDLVEDGPHPVHSVVPGEVVSPQRST